MTTIIQSNCHSYLNKIQALPTIQTEYILEERFLMQKSEDISVYYAPFEYVNPLAKVVIVGITPGLQQMIESYSVIHEGGEMKFSEEALLKQVKDRSSFKGTMRKHLISMLDDLGLNKALSINSTEELFTSKSDLVHTTSLLRYPVFYKGKNYSGTRPGMLSTAVLKNMIHDYFLEEVSVLNKPFFIPLGKKVEEILVQLAEEGLFSPNQILRGFPHPSGANGHRAKQFIQNRESMEEQIKSAELFR